MATENGRVAGLQDSVILSELFNTTSEIGQQKQLSQRTGSKQKHKKDKLKQTKKRSVRGSTALRKMGSMGYPTLINIVLQKQPMGGNGGVMTPPSIADWRNNGGLGGIKGRSPAIPPGERSHPQSLGAMGERSHPQQLYKNNGIERCDKIVVKLNKMDMGERGMRDKKLERIVQGISHNLSIFINRVFYNNDVVKGVSNAYLKLWEIYVLHGSNIFPKSGKMKIMHMCEAPGNWIKCTQHYMLRFHPFIKSEWYANSLNPRNVANKEKYGEVFANELGLMAKHPSRWLFGADNTGDITLPANIKHISGVITGRSPAIPPRPPLLRKCTEVTCPAEVNLITGDAGISGEMPLYDLQKLEFAQFVMCIALSEKGANCIIKNFASSYYNAADIVAFKLNLQYTSSLIELYRRNYGSVHIVKPVTSNPLSSEYYIVGCGFKGCTSNQIGDYYKQLEQFRENVPLISGIGAGDGAGDGELAVAYGVLAEIFEVQYNAKVQLNMIKGCYPRCVDEEENKGQQRILFKEWMKKNKYIAMKS